MADRDRGLAVGVKPKRLLERREQPPARQAQPVARGCGPRRRRPGARLDLTTAPTDQLLKIHRADPQPRPGSVHRPAIARSAAGSPPPPSPAPPPTSAADSPGMTLKIRTNAPSLVITKPVRSIASTPNSSPASRNSARSVLTASIIDLGPHSLGGKRPYQCVSGRGSRRIPQAVDVQHSAVPLLIDALADEHQVTGPLASAGHEAAAHAPPAHRRTQHRPQVELGL